MKQCTERDDLFKGASTFEGAVKWTSGEALHVNGEETFLGFEANEQVEN